MDLERWRMPRIEKCCLLSRRRNEYKSFHELCASIADHRPSSVAWELHLRVSSVENGSRTPLGKHSYETEHAINEVAANCTDHQIRTRVRKSHGFNTILG